MIGFTQFSPSVTKEQILFGLKACMSQGVIYLFLKYLVFEI